jgi:hypothetical protein
MPQAFHLFQYLYFLLAVYTQPGVCFCHFAAVFVSVISYQCLVLHFIVGLTNILYNLKNVDTPEHYFNAVPVNYSTFRGAMNVI